MSDPQVQGGSSGPTPGLIKWGQADSPECSQLLDFVSIFVHDLEGPLASMQSVLKLLDRGRLDPGKASHAQLIRSSQIAIARARAIVADLLSVAKSEQLGLQLRLESVRLSELVQNSVDLIRFAAQEHAVAVEFERPPAECIVWADRELLLRVLDNLLFNAIRHSPPQSIVRVAVSTGGTEARVTVVDEGPGFQGFDPQELFDKYKQAELRRRGKHRGVGLGLFFCRIAVESLGGRIWAAERRPRGAEFNFTLKIEG